jgi:hypothetical protein
MVWYNSYTKNRKVKRYLYNKNIDFHSYVINIHNFGPIPAYWFPNLPHTNVKLNPCFGDGKK